MEWTSTPGATDNNTCFFAICLTDGNTDGWTMEEVGVLEKIIARDGLAMISHDSDSVWDDLAAKHNQASSRPPRSASSLISKYYELKKLEKVAKKTENSAETESAAAPAVTAAEASVSSLQPLRSEMSINVPPGGGAAGGGGRDICIVDGKVAEACAAANSPHEIACITLWCWATFPAMTTWTVLPGSFNRGSSPAAVGFQHNRVDGGWIMK